MNNLKVSILKQNMTNILITNILRRKNRRR